jgi:4-hydroxy-3-methylbut-2-enyl diphosphate reductase
VVVVLNPEEAQILADCMLGNRAKEDFEYYFGHKCTPGFDPEKDLQRFGVINQTTMLATETQEVMDILKKATLQLFSESDIQQHFADTSDTLCYATNENQSATLALSKVPADLAFVVGGYNSSNTMHLVEILEYSFPTYHVRDAAEIIDQSQVRHFNQWEKEILETKNWLDHSRNPLKIALTSGASCPDALVDDVLMRLLEFFPGHRDIEDVLAPFEATGTF